MYTQHSTESKSLPFSPNYLFTYLATYLSIYYPYGLMNASFKDLKLITFLPVGGPSRGFISPYDLPSPFFFFDTFLSDIIRCYRFIFHLLCTVPVSWLIQQSELEYISIYLYLHMHIYTDAHTYVHICHIHIHVYIYIFVSHKFTSKLSMQTCSTGFHLTSPRSIFVCTFFHGKNLAHNINFLVQPCNTPKIVSWLLHLYHYNEPIY